MKKIIYLIVMGTTVYLNMVYDWEEGAMAFSVELAFLFFCLLEAFFVRKKVKTQIEVKNEIIEQGEKVPVYVCIQNKSAFPTEVKLLFSVRYAGENKKTKQTWRVYLGGKKEETFSKEIFARKCGKMQLELKKIIISDWWGGFSFSKKVQERERILVMPKPCPVNLTVSHKTKWFPIESDEYATDRSGDDNTEIYEIREYRNGDRLQKVHWKVSARQGDLYVKEYSYPLGASVLVLLEGGKSENTPLFLMGVVSISLAMLEKKCPHYIAWKMKGESFIQRRLIKDEESFYRFLTEFLEIEINLLEMDMEEHYRYQYRNTVYSSMLIFTSALEIQVNHQEKMKVGSEIEKFFETTEIIV